MGRTGEDGDNGDNGRQWGEWEKMGTMGTIGEEGGNGAQWEKTLGARGRRRRGTTYVQAAGDNEEKMPAFQTLHVAGSRDSISLVSKNEEDEHVTLNNVISGEDEHVALNNVPCLNTWRR